VTDTPSEEPTFRKVGDGRFALEFQIEDLLRNLNQDVSVLSCKGCKGCMASPQFDASSQFD
jgi:hypothetical protein